MSRLDTEVFFCNKTYNQEWLDDKKISNTIQYRIINSIIETIKIKKGGAITESEILDQDPEVKEYVTRRGFKIIPAGGAELKGGGKGIRHVKYAPSKSVAVLWQRIEGVIYITFDDHAPIKYHRAIYSFHKLRLGRYVVTMRPRTSATTLEVLFSDRPWIYKGANLRLKGYFKYKRKSKKFKYQIVDI